MYNIVYSLKLITPNTVFFTDAVAAPAIIIIYMTYVCPNISAKKSELTKIKNVLVNTGKNHINFTLRL